MCWQAVQLFRGFTLWVDSQQHNASHTLTQRQQCDHSALIKSFFRKVLMSSSSCFLQNASLFFSVSFNLISLVMLMELRYLCGICLQELVLNNVWNSCVLVLLVNDLGTSSTTESNNKQEGNKVDIHIVYIKTKTYTVYIFMPDI